MQDAKRGDRSPVEGWTSLFHDESAFSRFRLLLVALLLLGFGIAGILLRDRSIDVKFEKEGTTVFFEGSRPTSAEILIPANRVWIDTGLDIEANQPIKLHASGTVNLAVHRLVAAANNWDNPAPAFGWTDPGGTRRYGKNFKGVDFPRRKLLVGGIDSVPGELLAYLAASGEAPDSPCNGEPHGPLLVPVEKIEHAWTKDATNATTLKWGYTGRLLLTVNDTLLRFPSGDPDKFKADFLGTPQQQLESYGAQADHPKTQPELGKALERRWNTLRDDNRCEAMFDDNVGEFFVQIEFPETRRAGIFRTR